MSGGQVPGPGERHLDQTPTWAVGLVCAVIVLISCLLEKVLHYIGNYFKRRHKTTLFEVLEKIKGELMVLGFISLLLTFGQSYIAKICIRNHVANTMLPCKKRSWGEEDEFHKEASQLLNETKGGGGGGGGGGGEHHRLLWNEHRMLSARGGKAKCHAGHQPLISVDGVHQLHIFIFFLACLHVLYSAITMFLGRTKLRTWKNWEKEAAAETDQSNDAKFRLAHETSFVRDHASIWTKNPIIFYLDCFFRQFFRSVRKSDYLTMRHGFISVHLSPGSKFDFRKYIKRSLEDDFKVIVGISPLLWVSAIIYLTLNVEGWDAMFWLSLLPLVVILLVGTKLQAIISRMAIEITEKHAVVQGIPLVQVSDRYFWFSSPRLLLHIIHLTLFQNAFEITYFMWILYEFGLHSCFHKYIYVQYLRLCVGIEVLFLCSYITLPLYALVTQMGSTMKKSIFDEQTSKALMSWQKNALKKKHEEKPGSPAARKKSPPVSPHDSPVHPNARKYIEPSPLGNTGNASRVDIPD
ncbi:Peptidylprolyl isomerase [Heracleum sosnowskyi]|uniref:MLO-like protein n=1 Tax=Heracleum sosnowskyi TaxID=360622 RepID=A0AAD8H7D9_9APIA|nr:Peptidylprolyl isomerase [Heracleum sosnowskyi]